MKITTLIENGPQAAGGLVCEHGLSLLIETEQHKILFDTGASSAFMKNAGALGINLKDADICVLSHGHYDHLGGVLPFAGINKNAKIYVRAGAFDELYHGEKFIGADKKIEALPNLSVINQDVILGDGLYLFGGFPQNDRVKIDNVPFYNHTLSNNHEDDFAHEQSLAITENGKTVVFGGCAHSGALTIIRECEKRLKANVCAYVGGFHLAKKSPYTPFDKMLAESFAAELKKMNITCFTGHCTSDEGYEIIKKILGKNVNKLIPGESFIL